MYNVVIIEDNPTDLSRIQKLLQREYSDLIDISEIKIFATKEEAKEGLLKLAVKEWPNLVFLDIQLQGDNLGGFKVMDYVYEKLGELPFSVIILTSYHEPAIEWGKRRLKYPQFISYVVKGGFQGKNLSEQLREALNELKTETIAVPTRGAGLISPGIRYIPAHNIFFIKADNNNSVVHLSEEKIHSTKTLGGFIEELPFENFIRVHRSYYVNLIHAKEVQPNGIISSFEDSKNQSQPRGGVLIMNNDDPVPLSTLELRKQIQERMKKTIF